MQAINELRELNLLISKKGLDKFSGDNKFIIKIVICAIFINIISGTHYGTIQKGNLNLLAQLILHSRNRKDSSQLLLQLRPIVEKSLSENAFIPPYDIDFYNRVLNIFRKNIRNLLNDKVSFIKASDFQNILDLEGLFGCPIKPYQWLDFRLNMHLTPNYPDMIIFSDLKVIWNIYIEKWTCVFDIPNVIHPLYTFDNPI